MFLTSPITAKRTAPKPPPGGVFDWTRTSETWWTRKERLTEKYFLYSCRRPEGYVYEDHTFPYGWVYLMQGAAQSSADVVESYRLDVGSGPLELECICHELRARYA